MSILVLNAGSTSVKFALFRIVAGTTLERAVMGAISGIGGSRAPQLSLHPAGAADDQDPLGDPQPGEDPHQAALAAALDRLQARGSAGGDPIRAVAHRVVHGGLEFRDPVVVDAPAMARLRALVPLAPLHQPYNLAGIEMAVRRLPGALQVAGFDTAFHLDQPHAARLYALPRRFTQAGVIRYGFHGLSYQHIAQTLRRLHPATGGGRVVAAHLGGGASLCALRAGRSVAATMGFTALDGLPMGTRVGDLDPGAVLYLIETLGLTPAEVSQILYTESGLKGVSGMSGDMRTLLASDDPHAAEAVDLFVYRILREVGSMAAALGGLDTLVFTGGVGEHAAPIRARVAEGCAWLGVALDLEANMEHAARIDLPGSRVAVHVVAADEERMLAEAALRLLRADPQR